MDGRKVVEIEQIPDIRIGYEKYLLKYIFGDVSVLYCSNGHHTIITIPNSAVPWWPNDHLICLEGKTAFTDVEKIVFAINIAYQRGELAGDKARVKRIKEALCMR